MTAQAAITKYHKTECFVTEMDLFAGLEMGSPQSRSIMVGADAGSLPGLQIDTPWPQKGTSRNEGGGAVCCLFLFHEDTRLNILLSQGSILVTC